MAPIERTDDSPIGSLASDKAEIRRLRAEVERLREAMESAVGVLAHGDAGGAARTILQEAPAARPGEDHIMAPMQRVSDNYDVRIIPRDGFGQINDDWHATITRRSDGKQILRIARWRRVLLWQVRSAALDRAFARVDKHSAKMARVEDVTR